MQNSELREIFDKIVLVDATEILDKNPGLFLVNNAFELFLKEYNVLHNYFLNKYMSINSKGLDTHKEIATIIISLLKVKIIKTLDSAYYETPSIKYAFNEELAFRVGCDILKSAIVCDYEDNKKLSKEEVTFSVNEITKKLLLPKTSYQSYMDNVITEFYYTSREGNFNFLATADKFFWIEYFNKRKIKENFKLQLRKNSSQ